MLKIEINSLNVTIPLNATMIAQKVVKVNPLIVVENNVIQTWQT